VNSFDERLRFLINGNDRLIRLDAIEPV